MWIEFNPNPRKKTVDDCSVRALSKALDISWKKAYTLLTSEAFNVCDMPHANAVWGAILRRNGFERQIVPNSCPDCYTVRELLEDTNKGKLVISVPNHVVTAIDGNLYDTWDSEEAIPQYFWYRKE